MQQHYQYANGGIPAEYQTIAEALRVQVQQVREKYIPANQKRIIPKGNVAVARLEIFSNPNQSYSFEATSKESPMDIPGKPGGLLKKLFPPSWDSLGEYYNETHAEYKLFNAIGEKIQKSKLPDDLEGILYLYTEKDTCSGCYATGDDFNHKFPNIRLIIFYDRLYP